MNPLALSIAQDLPMQKNETKNQYRARLLIFLEAHNQVALDMLRCNIAVNMVVECYKPVEWDEARLWFCEVMGYNNVYVEDNCLKLHEFNEFMDNEGFLWDEATETFSLEKVSKK